MIFKCNKCGYEVTKTNVRFKQEGSEMIPNFETLCPICKEGNLVLDESELTVGDINFEPNKFASMDEKGKKEALKKRAADHHKKFTKKEVEQKRNDTINNIKEQFERGIHDKGH